MKQHVDAYPENIKQAEPSEAFVNNQWANFDRFTGSE